jgi:hypothetical protein
VVARFPQKHPRPGRAQSKRPLGLRGFQLDRRRALIAGGVLVLTLSLITVIGSAVTATSRMSAELLAQSRARELAKGPILFLPRTGNECRQSVIDNDTWRIRDTGKVDCDTALGNAPPREGAPSRTDVIRKGFRNN